MKTSCFVLSMVLSVVVLLTMACAPATTPTSAPPTPQATTGAAPATRPAAAQTTAPVEPTKPPAVSRGGSITIVQGPEPLSLNPSVDINKTSINVQFTMMEPLVYHTPDNKTIPWLAESWQNPNPTTWRFKLRKGVKFHNGEDFNAESVIFSVKTYNTSKGEGKTFFQYIKDIKAVDDTTVDIMTEAPNPTVAETLAFLYALPPKYYAQTGDDGFAQKPVGTGPFTFVEWTKGVQIKVKANPAYWGGVPALDEVVFKPGPESSTRVAMLETGQAQIIANVPPELTDRITKSGKGRIEQVPSLRMIFVEFNDKEKPLDDVRVRKALNYAINKESLIKDVLGGFGQYHKGVILPGWLGYNPDALAEYKYDPGKAKQLLAEAGYPNGFSVDFHYPIGRYLKDKEVAEAIAGQLAEVGVKTNLQGSDIGTLVNKIHTQTLSGMHFFSMAPNISDPDYLWKTHFYSQGLNQYAWTAKTDQLIDKGITTVDVKEREKTYQELEQYIVNEHVPWIFMYLQNLVYGVSSNLDWKPRPDEIIDLRQAKLK
jgi:peptide/nickel transport system substrate-binding protein